MHIQHESTWKRHTLWLSLLVHLLFLLSLTVVMVQPKHELPSSNAPSALQSYLTPSPVMPPSPPVQESMPAQPAPVTAAKPEPQQEMKKTETDINGIEKPVSLNVKESKPASKPKPSTEPHKPLFAKDSMPEDVTNPQDEEPLHLIGESKIVPPLIKILARALSRHLMYPRVAADFNLRGTVLVSFILHPEGYVTGARVLKSSGAGVLDDAARDAVGAMSPVGDVHEYVAAPEFLVIGIIFG